MSTQVHKVELLIVDHDDLGPEGVIQVLENNHYPNHCMSPTVMRVVTQRVEWTDDHSLNKADSQHKAYLDLFPDGSEKNFKRPTPLSGELVKG